MGGNVFGSSLRGLLEPISLDEKKLARAAASLSVVEAASIPTGPVGKHVLKTVTERRGK